MSGGKRNKSEGRLKTNKEFDLFTNLGGKSEAGKRGGRTERQTDGVIDR